MCFDSLGWINQLLSWSPFIPLGRLTYCAYLIHPMVQVLYFENRVDALYFSNYDLVRPNVSCMYFCITLFNLHYTVSNIVVV